MRCSSPWAHRCPTALCARRCPRYLTRVPTFENFDTQSFTGEAAEEEETDTGSWQRSRDATSPTQLSLNLGTEVRSANRARRVIALTARLQQADPRVLAHSHNARARTLSSTHTTRAHAFARSHRSDNHSSRASLRSHPSRFRLFVSLLCYFFVSSVFRTKETRGWASTTRS